MIRKCPECRTLNLEVIEGNSFILQNCLECNFNQRDEVEA